MQKQINAIAVETDEVARRIAGATESKTRLDMEMTKAYQTVQDTQQEQIAMAAMEQAALKQHAQLYAARRTSLAALIEISDSNTAALLQQEMRNVESEAAFLKQEEEVASAESNQIKNAVASAAAADEAGFLKRGRRKGVQKSVVAVLLAFVFL